MPIINFQCIKCDRKFSELVFNHTKNTIRCPECQGDAKQIYEGKCNDLRAVEKSTAGGKCSGCSMGCNH